MQNIIKNLITKIGENPEREGLINTPKRVERSYDFLTSGYKKDLKTVVNNATFEAENNEMVIVKDIEFYSLCEHHLLPFYGKCHIGYIPGKKIIGLSKLARITDMYARRLQVQERMTSQIAEAIEEVLNPIGVGIVTEAKHLCMMMRGVQKQNSYAITSALRGKFKTDVKTRNEFTNLLRKHIQY